MASLMHLEDEKLTQAENLRLCGERIELMRAIASRRETEGITVRRIATGAVDNPFRATFEFTFEGRPIFDLDGEPGLVEAVMQLVSEVADIFVQFENAYFNSEQLIRHVLTARKFGGSAWFDAAAKIINSILANASADGRPDVECIRFGDRLVMRNLGQNPVNGSVVVETAPDAE